MSDTAVPAASAAYALALAFPRPAAAPAPSCPGGAAPVWEQGNLAAAFSAAAAAAPDRPALVTPAGEYTYAALLAAATAVRDRLAADPDFQPGDRVPLLLPNGPEYVAAFYGTLLAGGVVVPLPPDAETDRLRRILDCCEARLVLTSDAILRRRAALGLERRDGLRLGDEDRGSKAEGRRTSSATLDLRSAILDLRPSAFDPHTLAALFFTSGSTGDPKGVMLSHANLLANARSICEYLAIGLDERALGLLPFYHAFGNSVLQSHLLSGAAVVLDGSLMFPETILDAVRDHGVTSLSGVPDMFRVLLSRTSLGETPLPSLRTLTVAGGRLEPDQAEVLAARAAPARLVIMYGQTEATARLSYLPAELLEERHGSIGRGIPGVELQVVNDDGAPVRPGETGEIRARGANVMLGYWRDPEGTRAVLRDGWLYTGDLATVDADGYIYPQGRRSGLVKIGGHRVHPREVEEFVLRHVPALQAVAVPYEAPEVGTRLALFVQPWEGDDSLTADDLRRLCVRELPRHKVPEHVEILDRVPLNDAYKIDRPALQRRAAQAAAAPPLRTP